MDYSLKMLNELSILEQISPKYEAPLKLLSKRIRNDFWNTHNVKGLSILLHSINSTYKKVLKYIPFFDIDWIVEYIRLLAKYCIDLCPNLYVEYYNKLIDDIQLEDARVIIEEQWKDITSSKDGLKSFKDIFDDIFTKCISIHKDKFFHKLNDTDILCRAVKDKPKNKNRFVPDKNKTNNRWNPPGKTYLYLSFAEKHQEYDKHLSLNEYICLEEIKADKGINYYFCDFKPLNEGVILDLSYNDVSFRKLKQVIDTHADKVMQQIVDELLSDPDCFEKYSDNSRLLRRQIKKTQSKYPVNENILRESYAKQYLKMVCNCIYKKVDETDGAKKELAYKSFHALAQYLEEKGVTGIIYPCTRTKKVVGKNLVLFNKYDAEPIESSIREIKY